MAGKIIRTVAVKIKADVTDFEKKMKAAQKAMTNAAEKMKSIGKDMSAKITLPILAVATASSKMAMGFQQSMKQVENNLNSSANSVKSWVENNARAFNMAKTDASQFAATYSNLLTGFLNDSQAADFTKALLQQSSVIANKTGRSIDDVMERIRSGLLGSTEAIEDLGINVNVALLQTTDAFKKIAGNNNSWDKLTFQAQQQIRLFAILEQSIKKYGTELDQSANSSLQGMVAKAKDLALELGERLMPYIVKLLDAGNKLLDWLNQLDPQTKKTILVVAGLAAAVGPLSYATGSLVGGTSSLTKTLAAMPPQVAIGTAAITGMTAALIVLYNKNEEFRTKVDSAWNSISSSIENAVNNINKAFGGCGTSLAQLADKIENTIVKELNIVLSRIELVAGAISDLTEGKWKDAFGKFTIAKDYNLSKAYSNVVDTFNAAKNPYVAGKIYADREREKLAQRQSKSPDVSSLISGFKAVETAGEKAYDTLNDSVKSFIDSLKNQTAAYMDFVGVFESANSSMVISGERWINRLKGQLKATQTYQQSLATLQGKAQSGVISNQLLQQLQSMGVGSAAQLQALTKMSDAQLRQASDLYSQRYDLSHNMAYDSVMRDKQSEKATNQIVVQITGNTLVVDDEEAIDRLASIIAQKIK